MRNESLQIFKERVIFFLQIEQRPQNITPARKLNGINAGIIMQNPKRIENVGLIQKQQDTKAYLFYEETLDNQQQLLVTKFRYIYILCYCEESYCLSLAGDSGGNHY